MTATKLDAKALYQQHAERLKNDLFEFLRFKSISSEAEFEPEMHRCCDLFVGKLQAFGMKTEVWTSNYHPCIYAEDLSAGPSKPTVLIYNHYDVQPVDPLDLWKSDPFEPRLEGQEVFARGAQDNKGQCNYVMSALRALKERDGKFPVNIKMLIEGEEEHGSQGLNEILPSKADRLKADYLLVVDLGIPAKDRPAITLGIRGMVAFNVTVTESFADLHSGLMGGIAYNPNRAICEVLASVKDATGRVVIPGFYDGVQELTAEEKKTINFTYDAAGYKKTFNLEGTGVEGSYTPHECSWVRPTFEINGVWGGYNGNGFKTVIPAKAQAKVSCRLVPGQDGEKVGAAVKKFLESKAPKGTKVEVEVLPGIGAAVRSDSKSKAVAAFAKAFTEVFGKPCEFVFEGGSIPVIAKCAKATGADVVLLGLGLADDQIHAPNEHFGLDRSAQGFQIIVRGLEILGSCQ